MTNVEKLCVEVLEASEKADAAVVTNLRSRDVVEYRDLAANNAPKLARALMRAVKGLDFVQSKHNIDFVDTHKMRVAATMLADIEEILK